MNNNNILKFIVAIENRATKELENIEKQFNNLGGKVVTVVNGINENLKNIGGVKITMPEISQFLKQIDTVRDNVSKKDVGEIPIFKHTLEQMQQLENHIGKNSLAVKLQNVKQSINGVFGEIPNVNASSFASYFKQLQSAYSNFVSKMGNTKAPSGLDGLESRLQTMGALSGQPTLLKEYQAQAEQFKATVVNAIKEANDAIRGTKILLQGKGNLNFEEISKNIDSATNAIGRLTEAFVRFNGSIDGQKLSNVMAGMGEVVRNIKFSLNQVHEAQSSSSASKSMTDLAKSMTLANSESQKLSKTINGLKEERLVSKGLGFDTTQLDVSIRKLEQYKQLLESVAKNNGISSSNIESYNGLTAMQVKSLYSGDLADARAAYSLHKEVNASAIRNEANANAENSRAKKEGADAANRLTQEETRLLQAINHSTNGLHNQSQVLSDLKNMALQYLSVYGAQRFVTDMAQITGELQLQRKSLEVILNSASAAQQMYSEIRDLSQMSPYTFEDLLKSHRQLAAFGIEAKDVFGTLKSLSDIGAGLDVDVSRLILAYGHTKSYGYLSGIQNRQFENAGIDLVGALADKYNRDADQAKREGRAYNYVSRRDIFGKMREKSIPFEDVQDVVMDLDKPGGRFYNMQIEQFETLGGKLRNLRNNYRIMMSELGESNEGFLSGSIAIINDVTENWQKYATVLKSIAAGYSVMKLAHLAMGQSIMATNKAIMASSVRINQERMGTAYLNTSGPWYKRMFLSATNPIDKSSPQASNALFNSIKNDKDMNNITKQRIALVGRLSEEQRKALLVETGVSRARAAQIAGFAGWRRGLMSVRLGMIQVGQAAKSMAAALLTNPMTWIMAGVAAFTALADKLGESSEQAEEFANNMKEVAKTDLKGIRETLNTYQENGIFKKGEQTRKVSNSEGTVVDYDFSIDKVELEARGVATVFEDLKSKLQTISPMYDRDYFDIYKAEDQAGQVEEMFRKIKDIEYVKQTDEVTGEIMKKTLEETDISWWNPTTWLRGESFETDLKDYADAYQEFIASFDIKDSEWNRIGANDKAKIQSLMDELHLTRNEAFAKLFDESRYDDVSGSDPNLSTDRRIAKTDKNNALEETKDGGKIFADGLAAKFKTYFGGNVNQMILSFENTMNQVFAGAKIGNAEVQAQMSEEIAVLVRDAMIDAGNVNEGNEFLKGVMMRSLGAFASNEFESLVTKDTREEDLPKFAEQSAEKAVNAMKKKSKEFASWWGTLAKSQAEKNLKEIAAILNNKGKSIINMAAWQKRAKFKYNMSVEPNIDNDWYGYIKKKRQEILDKAKENLEFVRRFKQKYQIDIDFDLNDKNALEKLSKISAVLHKAISERTFLLQRTVKPENKKKLRDEIEELKERKAGIDLEKTLMEYFKGEGLSIKEPDKERKESDAAKRKAEEAKRKAEEAKRKADRDWIQQMRHYIQSLGEAYRMYKMWYKDLNSEPAAIAKVREAFGKELKDSDFKDITSIEGYQRLLESTRTEVGKHKFNYGKDMSDERKSLVSSITKTFNDLKHDKFSESSEKITSDMETTLEELKGAFETFSEVVKSTGDELLADDLTRSLTGLIPKDVLFVGTDENRYDGEVLSDDSLPQNVADSFKNALIEELSKFTSANFSDKFNFPGAGEVSTADYLFNSSISKEELEKRVGWLFNTKKEDGSYDEDMQKLIPSVLKLVSAWQKLAKDEEKKAIKQYSGIVSKSADYNSVLKRNNEEHNENIRSIRLLSMLGLISEKNRERAFEISDVERQTKNLKESIEYIQFFGNSLAQTREQAKATAESIKENLVDRLKTGRISASDYAKEIAKVQDVLDKWETNSFFGKNNETTAFVQGGLPGLGKFYKEKIETRTSELAKEGQQKGLNREEIRNLIENDPILKKLNGKNDALKKFMDGIGDVSTVLDMVIGGLEGLNEAARALSDMFDALGDESKANFWSDVSDTIGGITSIFTPVGDIAKNAMSGNVGGIVSSAISAPFKMIASPVAAFSRLHDKKIERHIEKLREDISKIEGYTQTISTARERTLGYDNGELIRSYQRQYAENSIQIKALGKTVLKNNEGAAGQTMADYYSSAGGGDISGYTQQLNLLKAKRGDYVDMYNKESGKKKKSASSLEEYKTKIAELDDQIRHFAQDMEKELWGIDVKGWAGQLSDALANAFENGESMAKAYNDTVRSIMQNVVRNMMRVSILEPMFKRLQDKLNAVFDPEDIEGSAKKVSHILGDWFGENGEGGKTITAYKEGMNSFETMFNDARLSLRNDSSSTLSSGIKGTSEETSDLLAGYINALRQDVSFIRLAKTQFYNEAWPDYIKQVTSMATTLGKIDANVAAIRSIISENGALYEKVNDLAGDLHSVIYGSQKLHIS